MTTKRTGRYLSRLARLEAAASHLPRSTRFVPAQQAACFQLMVSEYGAPGRLLPSSRGLFRAFAACAEAFPPYEEADLRHPAVASLLPALRAELTAFLHEKLEAKAPWFDRSGTWTDLACAGFRGVQVGMRKRGPTAQEWCAGLSDLETVFEAADCLDRSAICVERWLDLRDCPLRILRETSQLPAVDEAVLMAELGADTTEKRKAIAEERKRRFLGNPREVQT